MLTPAVGLASTVYAAPSCGTDDTSKGQVLQGIGKTGSNCDDTAVTNAFGSIVEVLSLIVGAVAVIMIIYSGFRYVTSAGDSAKVSTAKNALIYALVGIAVAVLAQVFVHFVANRANAVI